MRRLGSFLPGDGVGGGGTHWSGLQWRWLEWEHKMYSGTVAKYGRKIIPPDMNLQDWPVDYHELEPYYDRFEKLCGTSGKAGNLNGRRIDGGNIFEAPRKSEYPNPPLTPSHNMQLFEKAARDLGYHPFPTPAANASRALHQSRRCCLRSVPLLWLLYRLRVRGECQGKPALHGHPAGTQ